MAEKITQTSAGLRDALFDAMERLRDGKMAPEDAGALAKLSKEIVGTVRLELDVAKLRNEFPADTKIQLPQAINLGIPNAAIARK